MQSCEAGAATSYYGCKEPGRRLADRNPRDRSGVAAIAAWGWRTEVLPTV